MATVTLNIAMIGAEAAKIGLGAVAAAAAAAGAALVYSVKSALDTAGKFDDLAAKTNVSAAALQKWEFAAKGSGVSLETLSAAASKMQLNVGHGGAAVEAAAKRLGTSVAELRGMAPEAAFEKVAASLSKLPNAYERAAVGTALLGKAALEALPAFAGLEEGSKRAVESGAVMNQAALAATAAMGDEMDALGAITAGLVNNVGAAIAATPAAMTALTTVSEAMGQLSVWVQKNEAAIISFVTNGLVFAAHGMQAFIGVVYDVVGAFMQLRVMELQARAAVFDFGAAALSAFGDLSDGLSKLPKPVRMLLGISDADLSSGGAAAKGFADRFEGQAKLARDEAKTTAASMESLLAVIGKGESGMAKFADSMANAGTSLKAVEAGGKGAGAGVFALTAAQLKAAEAAAKHAAELARVRAGLEALFDAGLSGAMAMPAHVVDKSPDKQYYGQSPGSSIDEEKAKLAAAKAEADGLQSKLSELTAQSDLWSGALGEVSSAFQALGISASSALGQIMGGIGAGIEGAFAFKKSLLDIGSKDGLAKGLAVAGAVGQGIQVAMAAIQVGKAIWGLFSKSDAEKAADDAGKYLGGKVSKSLGETISKTAKDLKIDVQGATLLNLDKVMSESGKGAGAFLPQIGDLISGLAKGTIPAIQGVEQLDKAFGGLADEAKKAGDIGSRALAQVLQAAKAAGQETASMKAFISEQNAKISDSFSKTIEGLDSGSLGEAQGRLFGVAFSAAVAEKGMVGAVAALQGAFSKLGEAGVSLPPGIAHLFELLGEGGSESAKGAFGAFEGLKGMLDGIASQGLLTGEVLADLGSTAMTAFSQATAAELAPKDALAGAMPYLRDAVAASREYGVTLDANTAELVRQAEAAGYAFPPDSTDRLTASIDALTLTLGGVPPKFDAIAASGMAAAGAVSTSMGGMAVVSVETSSTAAGAVAAATAGMVDSYGAIVSPITGKLEEMTQYAIERGDYMGIAWNGAILKMPLFLGDVAPVVVEGFERLAEDSTAPLAGLLSKISQLEGGLWGVAAGAAGAAGAIAVLGGGKVPGLPSAPGGPTEGLPHGARGLVVPQRSGGTAVVLGEGGGGSELAAPVRATVRAMSQDVAAAVVGAIGGSGGGGTTQLNWVVDGQILASVLLRITKNGTIAIHENGIQQAGR